MIIKNLSLTNFRNHKKLSLDFNPQINLILGPNTSGKSNILEVIYFLATGTFIKAEFDKEVISYDEEFFRIDSELNRSGEDIKLAVSGELAKDTDRTVKIFEVNGVKKVKNKFLGNLFAVLFTPESLELVTDSPSLRRNYLDFTLSQVDAKYRVYKGLYEKVVRSRNKILERIREKSISQIQLEYWNMKILEYGLYIQETRDHFFRFVNKSLPKAAQNLGLADLEISYIKNALSRERLAEYHIKDVQAGSTLTGPHRDDFEFLYKKRSLKSFGSRGEQRAATVSLKICELNFIREIFKENPVLLLDDIFSELDAKHREAIINICNSQQTIITSADENLVPRSLREKAKIFSLKSN